MADILEHRIIHPQGAEDREALACLLRLRSESRPLPEIAAGLRAETGLDLSPGAVDLVLREVAGPAPRTEGGDPECFTGYLGGG
jgi:hypothetical protein